MHVDSEPMDIRVESTANRFGILVLLWVPRRETLKSKRGLQRAA
jgi:hypothetical protein